ncbi:MAG: 50S ribosomal protein L4 [Alphaproteobacteria bacterium]|nr:50S ribosomal protein L4 [Alphaproteobacteria bacterium]
MKIKVLDRENKEVGEIELDDQVFGIESRADILSRVVTWQLARRQAGTHSVKERGDVRGSTRKIYKQKGTGGARHGSKRGAQFRGGGIIFGPVVRDHGYDLQKKVRKLGLKMALSEKARTGNLFVFDQLSLAESKTRLALQMFDCFSATSALLIDGEQVNENMRNAVSNLEHLNILPQIGANVYDILRNDKLVISVEGVKALEARLR